MLFPAWSGEADVLEIPHVLPEVSPCWDLRVPVALFVVSLLDIVCGVLFTSPTSEKQFPEA